MSLVEDYKAQTDDVKYAFVDHTAAPAKMMMDGMELRELYYSQLENCDFEEIVQHTAHYDGVGLMYINF